MLPNLIIIGAQKCGTTSLHYYLNCHQDIAMSTRKELNFFIEEKNWHKGIQWYEKQFSTTVPIIGEASPNYTFYPHFRGVPERMYSVIPNAKLIYILRDPIKRMIADYIHALADGYSPPPLNEALLDFDANHFNARSKYYMQLQQFLEYYPMSRILILTQEELLINRPQTLQKVFRFLGIDDSFDCKQFNEIKHQTVEKRRKNRIGILLQKLSETEAAQLVPTSVRERIGKFLYLPFSTKIESTTLAPEVRQKIAEHLKDDVERLRKLTGLTFEKWDI